MEESRFIGLTLPHVLVRPPYSNDGKRHQDFYFKEQIKDLKAICFGAMQHINLYLP
ncbi:type VI secretion system contractile sheath large subunit [Pseudoalteromonas sp. B193]